MFDPDLTTGDPLIAHRIVNDLHCAIPATRSAREPATADHDSDTRHLVDGAWN